MKNDVNYADITIDSKHVIHLLKGQARSAQLWIDAYNRHQDANGVRNASLAIGKVFGIYNLLMAMLGGENVPEDVLQLMHELSELWERIQHTRLDVPRTV